jgi:hypothetical protein
MAHDKHQCPRCRQVWRCETCNPREYWGGPYTYPCGLCVPEDLYFSSGRWWSFVDDFEDWIREVRDGSRL